MEKTNYEFLCDDLKFLGFGDVLQAELKLSMENNMPSFELYFAHTIGKDPIHASLYFSKPNPEGYYFFTKYKLTFKSNFHHFGVFKGKGVSVKEGYNLMNGRAVFKQLVGKNGQKYNTWIEFDLAARENEGYKVNYYHEAYGYDLHKALALFPIKPPSENWDLSMLLHSLERGNLQPAILEENGQPLKVQIQANPKYKTITIHRPASISKKSKFIKENDTKDHNQGDDIENAFRKERQSRKKVNV